MALDIDFEILTDKNYRTPGWGIDVLGRSVTVDYQFRI
jgi:hypothetical protein